MNIYIAENLKKLRKAKDITQDELAESLGVSYQSVSKWERGDCFPDISLLPCLANYFGVSTDELLGMDKICDQEKIFYIFKTVHEYEEMSKYSEAISLLRDSIKVYPNNYSFLSELALVLTNVSIIDDKDDILKKKQYPYPRKFFQTVQMKK
jgi:transcriptional regulator with XRE-family HTH domain